MAAALLPMSNLCKSFLPCGGRPAGFGPCLCSQRTFATSSGLQNTTRGKWIFNSASSTFLNSYRHFFVAAAGDSQPLTPERLRPWISKIGDVMKDSNRKAHLQVVLFSPQIAGNTGSIARTCAAASVGLHLIEPLGFQIDDAKLKRAGLDYWPFVVVKVHHSWAEFLQYFKQQEKQYKLGDWLVFGSETSGLSPEALQDCADETSYGGGKVRIPMIDTYVRSLNLSVSVGIGIYEALRQLDVLGDLSRWDNNNQLDVLKGIPGDTVVDENSSTENLVKAVEV